MGSIDPSRPVRIGNAMGAVTDLPDNMSILARRNDLDFIVGDWMSEYNMAARGSVKVMANLERQGTADAAYEVNFLESIEPCISDIARNGIKLAVNAGCSDTRKLYDKVCRLVESKGVDLKVAWIEGDEVHDAVSMCRKEGSKFLNITTGDHTHLPQAML